jgi:hypothetical protein
MQKRSDVLSLFLLVLVLVIGAVAALGQAQSKVSTQPVVIDAIRHDVSPPLRDICPYRKPHLIAIFGFHEVLNCKGGSAVDKTQNVDRMKFLIGTGRADLIVVRQATFRKIQLHVLSIKGIYSFLAGSVS